VVLLMSLYLDATLRVGGSEEKVDEAYTTQLHMKEKKQAYSGLLNIQNIYVPCLPRRLCQLYYPSYYTYLFH